MAQSRFAEKLRHSAIGLSYIILPCHFNAMMKPDSKWRDKALAIEFWIATALVGGSFVAGAISGMRALLGN